MYATQPFKTNKKGVGIKPFHIKHQQLYDKIKGKWGFKIGDQKTNETIQQVNYTQLKEGDDKKYGDAWVLDNQKLAVRTEGNPWYNSRKKVTASMVFVAGPNANNIKRKDSGSMARTFNIVAHDNKEFYINCIKASVRAGLDAMIDKDVKIPIIALIGTGLYAGPHKKLWTKQNKLKTFEKLIVTPILEEKAIGQNLERRSIFFDEIHIADIGKNSSDKKKKYSEEEEKEKDEKVTKQPEKTKESKQQPEKTKASLFDDLNNENNLFSSVDSPIPPIPSKPKPQPEPAKNSLFNDNNNLFGNNENNNLFESNLFEPSKTKESKKVTEQPKETKESKQQPEKTKVSSSLFDDSNNENNLFSSVDSPIPPKPQSKQNQQPKQNQHPKPQTEPILGLTNEEKNLFSFVDSPIPSTPKPQPEPAKNSLFNDNNNLFGNNGNNLFGSNYVDQPEPSSPSPSTSGSTGTHVN